MKTVEFTSFEDWKDTEGILASIGNSLNKMGIRMIENPLTSDSDGFSFILLKKGFDKEELYQILREGLMINYGFGDDDMEIEENEEIINREVDELFEEITGDEY